MVRARRGSLLSVLAGGVCLLLMCLALASLTVADLHFAVAYQGATSQEWLARAAVSQFIQNDRKLRQRIVATPPETPARVDWLQYYATHPVFPGGSDRLGGTARITFDSTQPYYSVDNTLGQGPISGWVDRGATTQSVPPLCTSLIVTTESGSRISHFEALLELRWPYALVSAAPIRIGGTPQVDPANPAPEFSELLGSILLTDERVVLDPPISGLDPMFVRADTYEKLRLTQPLPGIDEVPVRLGHLNSLDKGGNRLVGQLDSETGVPLTVTPRFLPNPPNVWKGRARSGRMNEKMAILLTQVFQLPANAKFPDTLPNNSLELVGPRQYLLPNDLTLGPPSLVGVAPSLYRIDGSLLNATPDGSRVTNAVLKLRNCSLLVDGDVDLSEGGVQGENATLIVKGNLVLREGKLDAGGKGMVIRCQRFVANASGSYRGLICADGSASFVEPDEGPATGPMEVRGGIIASGNTAPVLKVGDPGGVPLKIGGVRICSASFRYDPLYLSTLNSLADYQLVRLRRLD